MRFRTAAVVCLGVAAAAAAPVAIIGQAQVEVDLRIGHAREVRAVAFSPDGRTLATAGQRGIVKLWDSETGLLLGLIDSDATFGVDALRFSPDGLILATIAREDEQSSQPGQAVGGVRLWDVKSRKLLYAFRRSLLPGAAEPARRSVEFSNDGRAILAWDEQGGVRIDLATGERRWELAGTLQAISRDKRLVAVSAAQENIAIHDLSTGGVITTLNGVASARRGPLGDPQACLPDDGSWIAVPATTYRGAKVSVFETTTGQLRWSRDISAADFVAVLCAPSGNTVVALLASSANWRRNALVLDASNGEERARFVIGEVQMRHFSLSNDGRTLAVVTADQQGRRTEVALWDTSSGTRRQLAARDEPRFIGTNHATFSPDGRLVAVNGPVGEVRLFEIETGQERWAVASAWEPDSLVLSSDGLTLVAVSQLGLGTVNVWDAASGTRLVAVQLQDIGNMMPLADGRTFVVARVGALEAWDAATRQVRWKRNVYGDKLVASADGSALAFVDSLFDRTIRLFDAATGRVRCTTKFDRSFPTPSIALSPDGGLAAVSDKSGISILDARTCRRQRTIGDSVGVNGVTWWLTWSPDGAVLVAGQGRTPVGPDTTTRYWDMQNWRLLRTERQDQPIVFSPDGKRILRRSGDGNFDIVETATGQTTMVLRHGAFRRYQPFPWPAPASPPPAAFSPDGTMVWTARQGELHAWTVADGQVRATVAMLAAPADSTAGEWVAFTPDGYWHSSPGAERHLNWRMDGHATQAADVAERLHVADRVVAAIAGKP